MIDLTERQEKLLAFVVQEYVESATPVGSETLRRRGLGVSSATIRNELASLEDDGYLTHPHTSAGRVPTEKGYRYFVESLMEEFELPIVEQRMISHQFHQVTLDVDQWMRLTAAVVARASHSASLVTAPQSPRCRFKHVQLIAINEQVALLVLVLHEGTVKQQMLALASAASQVADPPAPLSVAVSATDPAGPRSATPSGDDLTQISNGLNGQFAGLSVDQIASHRLPLSVFENEVVRVVIDLMQQIDRRTSHEIYRDGIVDILKQPEFSAIDRMQALLEMLEQQTLIEGMLSNLAPERGVQVVIGGESHRDEMNDYSIVLARYGFPEANGVIGVLGPLRMPYARTIGVVRYVAGLLDSLIERTYGS